MSELPDSTNAHKIMALQTDTIIGLLSSIEAQANNRSAGNKLTQVIRDVKNRVEARKTLGEDPDLSKLPALYQVVADAVTEFNASNNITMPSMEEVQSLVQMSESVNPE